MKDYIFFNTFETKSDSPNYPGATYVVTNNLKCLIDDYCLEGKTEKERNQILNCIYMFLKRTPFYQRNQIWYFVWFENKNWLTDGKTVNTWFLLNEYPKTINDKVTQILENLSLEISVMGEKLDIDFESNEPRAFLPESDNASINLIFDQLCDAGLFDKEKRTITIKGLERLEERNKNRNSKKIFIASQFKGFENTIQTIKDAVVAAGFIPICMTDHQTNDYIMPEIFKQIKESVAVVGEISSGNNGVYFELGYAKGLGINTIVISKKTDSTDEIAKAHFDIAQISTIYYDDLNNLKDKLIYRIKSTI